MNQDKASYTDAAETKSRIPVWLYPSTLGLIDRAMQRDNCKSRSEFLESAAQFYAGYLVAKDSSVFLTRTLAATVRGALDDTENRIASLLFKLAVETDMMMHIVATDLDITDDELRRLRGRCVDEVKRTKGRINFDDAVKFQQGI